MPSELEGPRYIIQWLCHVIAFLGSTVLGPVAASTFVLETTAGYQARYSLALLTLVPMLTFFVVGKRGQEQNPGRPIQAYMRMVVLLLPLVMILSLTWSMARYTIGYPFDWSEIFSFDFIQQATWLPESVAAPLVAVGIISVLSLAAVISYRLGQRDLLFDRNGVAQSLMPTGQCGIPGGRSLRPVGTPVGRSGRSGPTSRWC